MRTCVVDTCKGNTGLLESKEAPGASSAQRCECRGDGSFDDTNTPMSIFIFPVRLRSKPYLVLMVVEGVLERTRTSGRCVGGKGVDDDDDDDDSCNKA